MYLKYLNDPTRGLYKLNYNNNEVTMIDENENLVWSNRFNNNILKVEVMPGNMSTVRELIKIEFKEGFLIYSTNGTLLYDSMKSLGGEYPILYDDFIGEVLLTKDLKPGYYEVTVTINGISSNYQLFDTRGMCVYDGSDKEVRFDTYVIENELFQLKSRDSITIKTIEVKKVNPKQLTYIIGDSTLANHQLPYWGWGQYYQACSKKVTINLAACGRSLKSFELEGRLTLLKACIKPGDMVLVGFGHNDQKPGYFGLDIKEFLHCITSLINYCNTNNIQIKICTPIARRSFENKQLIDTHKSYVSELRKYYIDYLIDTNEFSTNLINEYGEEKSKELFVHSDLLKLYDNTHTSYEGAKQLAEFVFKQLDK